MFSQFKMRRFNAHSPSFSEDLQQLLTYDEDDFTEIEQVVARIIHDVRQRKDQAVLDYTRQFDRLHVASMDELALSKDILKRAFDDLSDVQKVALEYAAQRIRTYHEKQKEVCGGHHWQYQDESGTVLGQRVTALDRVGIYVPGGKAAYPSSVLMNALPAKIAGVSEIIMVVPTPEDCRNPLVLAAAYLADIDRVFTIGGAQAIAALAYGTETIPAVDKICGPGNAYVASAKRRVFGVVGIDMVAGPSEILVLADGSTDPDWIAMDLFSQAEHDELAQSILIADDEAYLDQVEQSMQRLLPTMPRAEVIYRSLMHRGALIKVDNMAQACKIANDIAPEHLEISTQQPEQWLDKIHHAGAIFLGRYTSESLGDYCAGPNHVLPTARTARFSSPLGVYDFFKRSSVIQVSQMAARTLGEVASVLAQEEGLAAHAKSAEFRFEVL